MSWVLRPLSPFMTLKENLTDQWGYSQGRNEKGWMHREAAEDEKATTLLAKFDFYSISSFSRYCVVK